MKRSEERRLEVIGYLGRVFAQGGSRVCVAALWPRQETKLAALRLVLSCQANWLVLYKKF